MKKETKELFTGLNKLVQDNEAFYFKEQDYGTRYTIRSYSYRLASWTHFTLPFAKDCRGTSFIYDKTEDTWELFTRGYQKFFNLSEGIPKDEYMKLNTPVKSFEKLDGSLIMVGRIKGELITKSKTSINSDHAIEAQKLVNSNKKLQLFLHKEIDNNITPVFELVGQGIFRIVLNYKESELIYLGSVDNINYTVFTHCDDIGVRPAETYDFNWDELLDIQDKSKPDIEGFVVQVENGEFIKVKVKSYVHLHHLKDNINNVKNLVHLILDDNLDDLIGNFQDDKDTLKYIQETQDKLSNHFNHLVVLYKELRFKFFNEFNEDKKEFSKANNKHIMFHSVIKSTNTSFRDVEEVASQKVKDYILYHCDAMVSTQKYLEKI